MKGLSVSTVEIRLRDRVLVRELNIENFEGGAMKCYCFMKQKQLSIWTHTSVGQKLPENWEQKYRTS